MTYLNIFNYEPRRSKVGVDEKENNVTRAFLTTLQKSPHFSKHFFSKLDIDLQKKVSYTFQTNQKEVNTLKRRTRKHYFLYISKENPFELEGNNNTTNPLPDGLINDEKNIIINETWRHRLLIGDWNKKTLKIENIRPFYNIGGVAEPDGLALSKDNLIYAAVFNTSMVWVFDTDGNLQKQIKLPAKCPTKLCFDTVGDLGLLVTEAEKGLLLAIK